MSDGRKISQVWSSFGGVQILVSFVLSSMVPPRSTSQVSLRGASARDISRNALLEKVVHERQLRNFTRRASAAAIFIQVLPFSHDFCFSHVVVTFGLYVKMRRLWCLDFGQCNGLVAEKLYFSVLVRLVYYLFSQLLC
ncbi:hypothetical protein HPP92_009801 [Vanilla planifolia]|uniref:Uncharacterized protein n=1 Tax=Vanilla planifolia TaxID=51239 RepID=A0A835V968_VANPL|nr:hypothetical protein HPP92_009801 [Vanilla planifolia]